MKRGIKLALFNGCSFGMGFMYALDNSASSFGALLIGVASVGGAFGAGFVLVFELVPRLSGAVQRKPPPSVECDFCGSECGARFFTRTLLGQDGRDRSADVMCPSCHEERARTATKAAIH